MGKVLSIVALIAISIALCLSGCNSGGCTELRSSVPSAVMYSSTRNAPITIDSLKITGIGVPGDSALYGPGDRLSTIYLPMPPQADHVQWRIAYMQENLFQYGMADTISLEFGRTPWFAGEECGAMYKYKISDVQYTTNIIDSVILVDSLVTNIVATTLKIYFRTSE